MTYIDNTQAQLDGRTGRVICARDREAITDGTDTYGPFIRYSTQLGDISYTDAQAYAGREHQAPRRAMVTLEGMGSVQRWGRRITQHFGIVIEAGPQIKNGLHVTLAQENAGPAAGQGWKSPPMEFGLTVRNRMLDGKVVKDANGIPILDEYLALKAHVLPNTTQQATVAYEILSNQPIQRGVLYSVGLGFVDGRGGLGTLELWMGEVFGKNADGTWKVRNNARQGVIYNGNTGYASFGSVYPAVGVYCHVGQVSPIAARLYGWREAPTT